MLRNDSGNGAGTAREIDSYRNRVGTLVRDDHLLAYLRVVVEDAPARRRRWRRSATVSEPTVTAQVRFLDDDDLHSTTLSGAGLASHLSRWRQQQHVVYGDVYQLRWLGDAEARRVAERLFPGD